MNNFVSRKNHRQYCNLSREPDLSPKLSAWPQNHNETLNKVKKEAANICRKKDNIFKQKIQFLLPSSQKIQHRDKLYAISAD